MNIQEIQAKSAAKAKELADRLGVSFNAPSTEGVEDKVKKRLSLMSTYHNNKDLYDSAITKLLDIVPAKELQSIIQKLLGSKN